MGRPGQHAATTTPARGPQRGNSAMSETHSEHWLVTTTPQDNRHLQLDLHARAFPLQPVFADPPSTWPQPVPAPAAPAAARALNILHVLDALDLDKGSKSTFFVPNAPGVGSRRTARPRAWDLVLVIDTGASMTAWCPTINSFVASAYLVPLFADVHIIKLHSQGLAPSRELFDATDISNAGVDNKDRKKVVLAITDGVGPAWRGQLLWQQFSKWAACHPLAILHVQPHPHWPRSALHTRPLILRSRQPGGANDTMEVKAPDAPSLDETLTSSQEGTAPDDHGLVIPVLELSKRWVEQWCHLLHSKQWVRQQVMLMQHQTTPKVPPPRSEERPTPGEATAEDFVVSFLSDISEETKQLTTLLAAAPLNRHTMQLVAGQLMPQTGPGNLAEILNSGLITVTDIRDPGSAPASQIVFDFRPGVRAALLTHQHKGLADCLSVARLIDTYLSPLVPDVQGLAQRIESLTPPDELTVTAENLPFLQVERSIFQAMPPGRHNAAVQRMEANIDAFQKSQLAGSSSPP
ncbi:SAV_2336 N-terminal domain-related protein [Streptomyces sp. NPDC001492]